jgi:hypothetical protein
MHWNCAWNLLFSESGVAAWSNSYRIARTAGCCDNLRFIFCLPPHRSSPKTPGLRYSNPCDTSNSQFLRPRYNLKCTPEQH